MTRTYNDVSARIRETIVEHMPKDAEITRIEFEGPRLAIYVKNVNLLSEQNYVREKQKATYENSYPLKLKSRRSTSTPASVKLL